LSKKIKLKRILAFTLVLIMLSCSGMMSAYAADGDLSGAGTEIAGSQGVSDASTSGEGGQASSDAEAASSGGETPTDDAAPSSDSGTQTPDPGSEPTTPVTDPVSDPVTDPVTDPASEPGSDPTDAEAIAGVAPVDAEPILSDQTLTAAIYTDDTMTAPADDAAVITVTGSLPEGGYITAWPVNVTIDDMQIFAAYDITIHYADGSEFQPDEATGETVSVNIDTPQLEDVDEVNVYHIEASSEEDASGASTDPAEAPADAAVSDPAPADSGAEDSVTATVADASVTATKVADSVTVDENTVEFDAGSFSIYLVVKNLNVYINTAATAYAVTAGSSIALRSDRTGSSNTWSVSKIIGDSSSAVSLSNPTTASGNATITVNVTASASVGDVYRIRYGRQSNGYDYFYIQISSVSITDSIMQDGCLNAEVKGASGVVISDLTGYTFTWSKDGTEITDPDGQQGLLPNGGQSVNVALTKGGLATYTLTVANGSGTVGTATYTVPYDMQLRNGGFEIPVNSGNVCVQYTNGTANLIWQSTGPGTGSHAGADVEIARPSVSTSFALQQYGVTSAASGSQLAELNCEAAGALYQDVLTTPGSSLYWSLYHRARSLNAVNASTTVDQMYVVVMSADQAQHFTNQTDLMGMISAVNSGSSTYNSYNISSAQVWDLSDNASQWYGHNNSGDAYNVSSGQYLTRFFFVAGTTAYEKNHPTDKTIGNLLDDVSFSQQLPYTIEYYVNGVKETYTDSGLLNPSAGTLVDATAASHYAALSSLYSLTATKLGYGSSDTNYGVFGSTSWYVRDGKTTLRLYFESGAVTVSKTFSGLTADAIPAGGYTVTFILKQDDIPIATTSIVLNKDTFVAGTPYIASFSNVTNGSYTITESVPDASGYSLTGVQGGTAQGTLSDITETKTVSFTVSGTAASVCFTNSYTQETTPDTPYLTVRKTFSGITEAMLTSMMETASDNLSYFIQLTKSGEDTPAATLYLSGATRNGLTLAWKVEGLTAGAYTVSETGANTLFTDYSLAGSTGFDSILTTASPVLTYQSSGETTACATSQFNVGLINMIVVKLTGPNEKYFVWTDQPLSVGQRQAVAAIINDNDSIAFSPNITDINTEVAFFSGNALIQTGFSFRGGTIRYDPSSGTLTIQASNQWAMFACGTYSGAAVPEIAVTNEYQPGFTLPITGGIGTVWFQVVGTLILAGGAIGLWMELSRGKKRAICCFPGKSQQGKPKL